MKSPHFHHPFRPFPYLPKQEVEAGGVIDMLLFKEINGDKGLRNACKFFWNVKSTTLRLVASCPACAPFGEFDESVTQTHVDDIAPPLRGIPDTPHPWHGQRSILHNVETVPFTIMGTISYARYRVSKHGDRYALQGWMSGQANFATAPTADMLISVEAGTAADNSAFILPDILELNSADYRVAVDLDGGASITMELSFEYWDY